MRAALYLGVIQKWKLGVKTVKAESLEHGQDCQNVTNVKHEATFHMFQAGSVDRKHGSDDSIINFVELHGASRKVQQQRRGRDGLSDMH